jgi:hypothetical protein
VIWVALPKGSQANVTGWLFASLEFRHTDSEEKYSCKNREGFTARRGLIPRPVDSRTEIQNPPPLQTSKGWGTLSIESTAN